MQELRIQGKHFTEIFLRSVTDYHVANDVDQPMTCPFPQGGLDALLYEKNWIDTVQWHLEDIIRDPLIEPIEALQVKRRIDTLNQQRTDLVEYIDSFFLSRFRDVIPLEEATFNTESPAWAIDRLSILCLKIYHMQIESCRNSSLRDRLEILQAQERDLQTAIDELLDDIAAGRKYMKVYRQMKMYNDPELNPVLYSKK
ncbi:MAG: DUF4254 domain-containing protein [Bacteroidales bacterium]|nr:DUF4254 domain-containing protein [Bacteroidales bacterium]